MGDEKIREIENLQEELKIRTEAEKKAEELIAQCRFDEADAVLETIR